MKKIICLINARGGSKRVKDKNILLFNSKPLIYWTIKAAQESEVYYKIYVNTDSKKIASLASYYNAEIPFLRPKYLADDNTSSVESTKYFLNKITDSVDGFDLLQPTSPLRTSRNIINFHSFIGKNKFKSAASISKLHNESSSKYILNKNYSLKKLNMNETNKKIDIFFLNGSMYYNEINTFLKYEKFVSRYTKGFKMTKKISIDIDTLEDFNKALKSI